MDFLVDVLVLTDGLSSLGLQVDFQSVFSVTRSAGCCS